MDRDAPGLHLPLPARDLTQVILALNVNVLRAWEKDLSLGVVTKIKTARPGPVPEPAASREGGHQTLGLLHLHS